MKLKIPKIVTALIIIAVYTLITLIFPITLALGNQEITNQETLNYLSLFSYLYFAGLIIILGCYLVFFIIKKNNKLGDNIGFVNLGEKPAISVFKRFTYPQIILLALVVFGWLFFTANILKAGSFTDLKILRQQFSPVDSLLFSSFLIPGSEEMLAMAIIGVSLVGLSLLSLKFNIKPWEYKLYVYLLIPILIGGFAVVWHNTAYQNSDVAKGIVFSFWTLKTYIVLLTGLFILGFILHFWNNFFIDTSTRFVASSSIQLFYILLLAGLTSLYLWYYRGRWFGSKKIIQIENG